MKNYIQNGDMITVTAPVGGVTSGQGLLVGSMFGVIATTAPEGEAVEIATTGVFDLPKDAATVIDQGDHVAWDDTPKEVAQPGVGLYPVGIAVMAAGNGTTTVRVRLDGIATAAA
jgi:predicted RecA/RadA family phage recombinase